MKRTFLQLISNAEELKIGGSQNLNMGVACLPDRLATVSFLPKP
jgi:hypothetical protein